MTSSTSVFAFCSDEASLRPSNCQRGRAVAQAVNRQILATVARVLARVLHVGLSLSSSLFRSDLFT